MKRIVFLAVFLQRQFLQRWHVFAACADLCKRVRVCVVTEMFVFAPVPQPPTITHQSPKDYIIDPRENIIIHCEAKGKPHPRWVSL